MPIFMRDGCGLGLIFLSVTEFSRGVVAVAGLAGKVLAI
jgi:hypothetical protein